MFLLIPKIKEKTKLKQWKSTNKVIKWFNEIKNKISYTFIKFDIEEFHPSISKGLLLKSIEFAKKYAKIKNSEIEIILHSCKTVLIHNNEVWIKKDAEKDLFDVPMGSYHGAEVRKLIGLFLFNNLIQVLPKDSFGLYCDEGLLIFKRRSKRIIEQTRKCIRAV